VPGRPRALAAPGLPLLQLPRSTLGSQGRLDGAVELVEQVHALARRCPRDGDRRVWALLRRRGQRVNQKRVHRLWKRATRQGRQGTRQRGPARPARVPVQATQPGHVWTDDLTHDHGLNGTRLQVFTVMDEFTREGLAIEVATSRRAPRVLAILEPLVAIRGAPQCIRSDNGPECIALALRGWLAPHQRRTLVHRPRRPLAEWLWGALQRHGARRVPA
jgi:putative transposase